MVLQGTQRLRANVEERRRAEEETRRRQAEEERRRQAEEEEARFQEEVDARAEELRARALRSMEENRKREELMQKNGLRRQWQHGLVNRKGDEYQLPRYTWNKKLLMVAIHCRHEASSSSSSSGKQQ